MNAVKTVSRAICATFPSNHVMASIKHYSEMTAEIQMQNWEKSLIKGGKFVEAILKALWVHCGQKLPPARDFKAGRVIDQLPQHTTNPSLSLLIPRACRLAYDIASNRDGRHDTDEISANQMDATIMMGVCSWILAELLRQARPSDIGVDEARMLVEELIEKQYPLIEMIDGRTYFNIKGLSARDVGLLTLWVQYPGRVAIADIKNAIIRHKFSKQNANVAVSRIEGITDNDGRDSLRLRAPGMQEADLIIRRVNLNGKK